MDAATLSIKQREAEYLLPAFAKLPIAIERGEGMYVWDTTGKRYLDLYGGHAVCLLGHSHPRLVSALKTQAEKLMFYSASVYSAVRADAAKALVEFVGGGRKCFFSNSGAEANENALKIARLVTGRSEVVSLHGSFHGRTAATLAVTGMEKYRTGLSHPPARFAAFGDIQDLRSKLDESVAALIIEPIQSLSGVCQASAEYFQEAARLCESKGILLIVDEIQVGLGRTGKNTWFSGVGITPDIVTLAKGLAGGFPIGVTLVQNKIGEKIGLGALGSTFGGGPLACALARETIQVLKDEKLVENAAVQGKYLREEMKKLTVEEIRGEGLLVGIKTKQPASDLVGALLERGILTGTSLDAHVLRLLPPLNLQRDQIDTFTQTMGELL